MSQINSCNSLRTGKPLMSYESKIKAESAAEYALKTYGNEMVPYRCTKCEAWHLTPKERHTPSTTCPHCVDSCGNSKQAYKTEEYARTRAKILQEERGIKLYSYECEYGYGWHLTKSTEPHY